jgi:hypothetical protein
VRAVLRLSLASAILLLSAGCVTQHQHYNWGDYDPSLYAYYKNPSKEGELAATLVAVIDTAAKNQTLVPPGIYAEYGYLQLEQGKNAQAIDLFKQEESHWPESKVFMDRMIKVASTHSATPAAAASSVSNKP